MKFISALLGVLSVVAAFEESTIGNAFRTVHAAVKPYVYDMPLRARDAPGLRDANGNRYLKTKTPDIERRYDESIFRVYARAYRTG